jgi:hypothetical protein
MIRTRDFLVYVLTLVFLVSAIGYTVITDGVQSHAIAVGELSTVPEAAAAFGALANAPENDRDTYIQAMREKIAQGLGTVAGEPVVLTSVDETPDPGPTQSEGRAVLWCDVPERVDLVIADWNSAPVTLTTMESTHVYSHESDAGSVTLLELPIRQSRSSADTCLSHEIVGVALDGSLIKNDDAGRFSGMPAAGLVGYALDGFPIYGPTTDSSVLDTCGGGDTGSGYAYHLRIGENFVLGCYAAQPAHFNG